MGEVAVHCCRDGSPAIHAAGSNQPHAEACNVGAWEKWQQVYADLKFANRMGGGAIRRMLNRKLSMAWEKWQFTAAEMARQQFLLQGAINAC